MSHSCDEQYDVYNETWRTARKGHVCSACSMPVDKGHRYCHVTTIYDGMVTHYKRCLRCQALHEHLRDKCYESDSRGYSDQLWPDEQLNCGMDYEEEWRQPPPPEIAKLAFWLPGDSV